MLDKQLADKEFIAGEYSIADMACWPWVSRYEWQEINPKEFECQEMVQNYPGQMPCKKAIMYQKPCRIFRKGIRRQIKQQTGLKAAG